MTNSMYDDNTSQLQYVCQKEEEMFRDMYPEHPPLFVFKLAEPTTEIEVGNPPF